jgi:hypothetical protein
MESPFCSRESSNGSSELILGDFNPPIENGGASKSSGTQNLSREGWDEGSMKSSTVLQVAIVN